MPVAAASGTADPAFPAARETMEKAKLEISTLDESEIVALQPLVMEFVQSHPSLPFKENCWDAFRMWFEKGVADENTNALLARQDGRIAGFIVGDIRESAPFFTPDSVGHVSVLVVAGDLRRKGVGDSLWRTLRRWFESRGVSHFELYTEHGNPVSRPFWKRNGFEVFLEKRRFT